MDSERCSCSIINPDDSSAPPKTFTFDSVYNIMATTEQIYNEIVYPLVEVCFIQFFPSFILLLLIKILLSLSCFFNREFLKDTIQQYLHTAKPVAVKVTQCKEP